MLLEVVADLEKAPAPSPAPAMHSTALAGLILTHLGYSTEPSLEPGADMRRDALARRLDEWLSPATPCAAPAHERVKRWAEQHHVSFVSRSHGLASTDTISFAALEALAGASPSPAVKADPLTEPGVQRLVEQYGPQSEDEEIGFRDGVRASERAHGIGEAQPPVQQMGGER